MATVEAAELPGEHGARAGRTQPLVKTRRHKSSSALLTMKPNRDVTVQAWTFPLEESAVGGIPTGVVRNAMPRGFPRIDRVWSRGLRLDRLEMNRCTVSSVETT